MLADMENVATIWNRVMLTAAVDAASSVVCLRLFLIVAVTEAYFLTVLLWVD